MSGNTIISSTSRKNNLQKWIRRRFNSNRAHQRKVLMIMGAQRSGTTLFSRIFDDLYFADVFGEFSELSAQDKYNLRLDSPEVVRRKLEPSTAELIVMKPLVESQNANYWLSNLPGTTVVWLYRNHRDMASSSVLKFGDIEGGLSQARAFVDAEFAQHDYATWKSENASERTVELIKSHYSQDMNPHDAAALFWYGRNALFQEQGLTQREDVILLKYEDFVAFPFLSVAYILNHIGIHELSSHTLSSIDSDPVGKGNSVELSAGVDAVCNELSGQLDQLFYSSPLGHLLHSLKRSGN